MCFSALTKADKKKREKKQHSSQGEREQRVKSEGALL